MKFLKTDVWRLNAPVFLSAHPKMPLASLALSAAPDDAIVVAKFLFSGFCVICEVSRPSRADDLSMEYVYIWG
jgi:hypothetical protein